MKKKFLTTLLICFFLAVSTISFLFYQNEKELTQKLANEQSNEFDLQLAKQKLNEWQPLYALELVKKHLPEIYNESPSALEWLNISLQAGAKLKDRQFLTQLFDWQRSLFLNNEEAAIVVAEEFIDKDRRSDFHYLKSYWHKNSDCGEKWTLLDSDACARNSESAKAEVLLSAKQFKQPYEVDRLLRLAFLNLNEHPKVAWDYLSEACKIDPENADLRIYRAHFLQAVGKEYLAINELGTSLQKYPNNLLLKEELIEQHIRNKDFISATALLNDHLAKPSSEALWLKGLFLSKVVAPVNIDKTESKVYFNEPKNNDSLPKAELSWLDLLHLLRQGKEEKAYLFALNEKALDIYHPELRQALIRALAHRNPSFSSEKAASCEASTRLFKRLENPPYANDLRNLLASEEAFSAIFLAASWNEAALQLRSHIKQPMYDLPEWYCLGITQAFAQNRSIQKAIDFAKQQKPSRPLALLLGELYLKSGNSMQAIAIFKKLAATKDSIGEKAAYFLANEYLEQGNLQLAKSTLLENQAWNTTEGRLILGRLALKLGDKEGADVIFSSLATVSSEAKSYLATKAFYNKDYALAYTLTKDLLTQSPNNQALKENLHKISQANQQTF